jgi:hypothetical protein
MKNCLKNLLLILISLVSSQIYAMESAPKGAPLLRSTKFVRVSKKAALRTAIMRNDLRAVQLNVTALGELDDEAVKLLEIAAEDVKNLRFEPESDSERIRMQIVNLLQSQIPDFLYRPLIGAVINPELREMFYTVHNALVDSATFEISGVAADAKTLVPTSTPELSLGSLLLSFRAADRFTDSPNTAESPRRSVLLEFLASDESRASSTPLVTTSVSRASAFVTDGFGMTEDASPGVARAAVSGSGSPR